MNSYELSRNWFNYCFENPEKIKPVHTAVYFFAIEHCNRLGWKEKFGFPSQMVMEAIGVKNWRTYSKALNEIVEFGFIEMIEVSKNQYSSNIIAIVKNTKAPTKALDKALQKHDTKQGQSTVSIDKQYNKELKDRDIREIEVDLDDTNRFHQDLKKDLNTYEEKTFLANWAKCREHYLKQPTHIDSLNSMERIDFRRALSQFKKEEIDLAMFGLFKQENISFGSMLLRPRHFLERVDTYLAAEKAKDYKLYGSKKVQV